MPELWAGWQRLCNWVGRGGARGQDLVPCPRGVPSADTNQVITALPAAPQSSGAQLLLPGQHKCSELVKMRNMCFSHTPAGL